MVWPKALGRAAGGLGRIVRSALFRPRCRLCSQDLVCRGEEVICLDCRGRIAPGAEPVCPVCGRFLPAGTTTCGSCLLAPPPFERHCSFAAYEGTLREVILLFKYGEIEALQRLLAGLYLETIRRNLGGPFAAVVPVPADRRRRRGFRPLHALGRTLARRLGVPFRPGLLVKKKSTPPQVGLTQAQRRSNLDGAFALGRGARVQGMHVLLVDDVATTGTTLCRCAAVLAKGGARVTALTLAQARA